MKRTLTFLAALFMVAAVHGQTHPRCEIPQFDQEFGQYKKSKPFLNFIFNNTHKIVFMDAVYVPDNIHEDEIVMVGNDTFDVDFLYCGIIVLNPYSFMKNLGMESAKVQNLISTEAGQKRMPTPSIIAAHCVLMAIL